MTVEWQKAPPSNICITRSKAKDQMGLRTWRLILNSNCQGKYLYLHTDLKRNGANVSPVSITFMVGFW
jgi:hypothetical protein